MAISGPLTSEIPQLPQLHSAVLCVFGRFGVGGVWCVCGSVGGMCMGAVLVPLDLFTFVPILSDTRLGLLT